MVRFQATATLVCDGLAEFRVFYFLQKDGTAAACVAVDLLESCQSDKQRDIIAGVIATTYAGKLCIVFATLRSSDVFVFISQRARIQYVSPIYIGCTRSQLIAISVDSIVHGDIFPCYDTLPGCPATGQTRARHGHWLRAANNLEECHKNAIYLFLNSNRICPGRHLASDSVCIYFLVTPLLSPPFNIVIVLFL